MWVGSCFVLFGLEIESLLTVNLAFSNKAVLSVQMQILGHSSCDFGGLEVVGSNPAEDVGFLGRKKKISARLPSEGK